MLKQFPSFLRALKSSRILILFSAFLFLKLLYNIKLYNSSLRSVIYVYTYFPSLAGLYTGTIDELNKVFSEKTWGEIKQDSVKFHYHAIENDKSIYKEIKFKDEIPTLYQFKLLGCKQSRIIGFYDEKNNFNIVAYDYSHQIYKRK